MLSGQGLKDATRMKGADQLTWKWGDGPGSSSPKQCYHRGPYRYKRKAGECYARQCEEESPRHGWLWRWKEASNQDMGAAPGSWTGKKTDSAQQPPEDGQPCQHFDFGPFRSISDSWPPELIG